MSQAWPKIAWASRPLITADAALGWLIETLAALLVVAEVAVLFAGVLARHLLSQPLIWSDEVASLLFLWLAVLGAVVAMRRREHMRMTALADRASPRARAMFEGLAIAATLVFLVLLISPAIDYASDETFVASPALELSGAWRAAALPAGLALMALTALGHMWALYARDKRAAMIAVGSTFAVVAGLLAIQPTLSGLGDANLVIFFVGSTALCVFAGVPIGFAFGVATLGFLALTTDLPISVLVGRMDEGMSHLILLAVPLFVLLGLAIEMTGMARAMVTCLANLFGHLRGGLSYVLIAAMYLVSGISGAKAADMAAIAPVLFPELKARRLPAGDLVALLAATGAQTETVPPSLVLITVGSVTGVSISALFIGGLLPAAVLAVILCGVVWLRYRREDLSHVRRPAGTEIVRSVIAAIPALALPLVIRSAVVEGIATATEVSTLGIAYTFVVGPPVYRRFDWRRLRPMLVETAALSGAILLIIGTATGMAWALTQSGFSQRLADMMADAPGGRAGFLAISIVAFVILGSVLEGIPAMVLFGPLLFPIARQLGVHEVHYAMVAILAMGVGLFAPPFGVGYYAACAIGRVSPSEGMRPILGYMLALLAGVALVAAVPWISIGLLP